MFDPKPIHVVLDQPPAMPEWVKILITASVGALLGVAGNILMEFFKPTIQKMQNRKTVSKQLGEELLRNLNNIDAGLRVVESVKDKAPQEQAPTMNFCQVLASACKTDRFDKHFDEQKSLVYEIDDKGTLVGFYELVKGGIPLKAKERQFDDLKQNFLMASSLARDYIESHDLTYTPEANPVEESYWRVTGGKH